jgi:hypothetical protein
MNLGQTSKEWFYLGIACLAAIVVMLPIVIFGIPSGNDLPQHFQFAQTYYDALVSGDGFPNWSARENAGYGGIGIRFYPPLAYYVLAFAKILVGNWFDAAWLTFIFWMVLGCAGVYYWARWWISPKESAIAAMFYAIAPYHLSQLYSFSFFYADFAAAAVLPFCFAYLIRVLERESKSDIIGLAIAYAALVLTHLPMTLIGSLSLAVLALSFLRQGKILNQIARSSAAIVLGLAASSFYWFRMVGEMSWLNHATDRYSSGHYYFANRFFPLYFHAIASDYKDNFVGSDVITGLCLLFLASPIVYLFYRRTKDAEISRAARVFRSVLPLGLFAFFMITPLSFPVWKILPPLQKIQFPMRWMAVVSMCGAVVTAAAIHFLLKGNFLRQRVWSYVSVIFLSLFLLLNFVYVWFPSAFVPIARERFENEMRELPEKRNQIFWWTIWSKPEALDVTEKVLAENRKAIVTSWESEERSFNVENGTPAVARIATFYYPRWKATVNDKPVNAEMDENGVMLIPLPAEKSTVKIFFQEPPTIRIAAIFSIVAWLFIMALFLYCLREKFARLKTLNPYFAEEEFSC